MKTRFFKSFFIVLGGSIFLLGVTAKAESIEVTAPTDFWFQYETETVFTAQTNAVSTGWSDPMLWLYTDTGELIAANDDYYGLQSFMQLTVQPGIYRLRAGVCCGDPERWWDGVRYGITVEGFIPQPSTTMETWTTTTETSTSSSSTSSTTTTTQPVLTTTTSTTSLPPLTTLTVLTTTSLAPTTSVSPSPSTTGIPRSSSSMPSTTTTSVPSVETTTSTTTTTTTILDSLPPLPTTTQTIPSDSYQQSLEKVYVKEVGVGPFKFTLKVSGAQRRTVVVASIIQVTTVASMSVPGVSNGGVTSRRRR